MAHTSTKELERNEPTQKERVAPVSLGEQLASTPQPSLPKVKETEPSVQITRS